MLKADPESQKERLLGNPSKINKLETKLKLQCHHSQFQGSGVSDSVTEVCRFKDMPRKKITNPIDRTKSEFSLEYEDENDNKKHIDVVEPVDFLIIDDEDD